MTNLAGSVSVDFIGRYEALTEDFAHVVREIGLPSATRLPRLQTAPKLSHANFYSTETRVIVEKRYLKDVELFEYEFPTA